MAEKCSKCGFIEEKSDVRFCSECGAEICSSSVLDLTKLFIAVVILLAIGLLFDHLSNNNGKNKNDTINIKTFQTDIESYRWKYDPTQDLWLPTANVSFYNTSDSDIAFLEIKVQFLRYNDIKCEKVFTIENIPSHRSKSIYFTGDVGYSGYTFPEAAKSWSIDVFKKVDNKWAQELHYIPDTFVKTK